MVDLSKTLTLECVHSASQDYATPEHSHDDHAMLLLPLKSPMTVRDQDGKVQRALEPRFFYFVDAGLPHDTRSIRSRQEHLAVYLNSDWQKFVLQQAGLSKELKYRAGIWRLTDDAIDLCRVLTRQTRGSGRTSRNLDRLGELFAEECLSLVQYVKPTTTTHPNDHSAALILDALNWLRQNFAAKIQINDLAEELGISRRHLTRLFRERTGLSIAEFLKEERLLEAQKLLEETDWSVQQIAVMAGIDNASQFSNAFSHRFGSTPTQYRMRHEKSRRPKS